MGKKRRGPTLEELMARPWCYYCERDFDDLKILTLHQKAKHFKCDRCNRRLNTAGGLSVHMSQVHKEQLTEIENALPNRSGLDVEIFGMEGVPEDVLQAHQQRVAAQYHQAEAERQAVTGNPPSGTGAGGQPNKKPKLEDVSDIKARLAAHRAKRAEAAAGGSSGEATPVGAGQSASTPTSYGQPPATASPVSQQQPPVQLTYPPPYGGAPVPAVPAAAPYQPQTVSPVYPAFSPPGAAPYAPSPTGVTPYLPAGYPQPFPGQPAAPGYGATPPPFPLQQTPPTDTGLPPRPGSLPPLAGLPQRPAFAAPPINAQQMQQMHMGHPAPPTPATGYTNGNATQTPGQISSSVDDLISSAAKEAAAPEKPAKKDKAKNTRMIYSDENTSPEEKMAKLARYAFSRSAFQQETALGEIPASVIVGTIREQDTVLDPAH
ncbi:putative C2H2 finger domain protein [Penicillium brasilianum]|uniref:Putative C2H2 finger domain protein n=1 Tax=Penicillium brasilianum TaxID=104259 RepID=A0A1S9RNH0_PENBI|nr:putative C2H2 finger domain protein [Penicillium brasilianum]